ncbi:MAG: PAS domain S-box protein [Solirubrobacteraceae bacterium]
MSSQGPETLAADRLLDVLDGVSVLMYVQDPEGRILHANRAACALVAKPAEEVIGKLPADLFDPATAERWNEQNREILETGRPLDVEDGWGGRVHLTHKTPVFDSEGKPIAVIGISTDISDRKRAEDELRRSERHLSEAQQIAGVGSWHWDSEAAAMTWSTELCRLFGVAPAQAPTGADALMLVHEDDRERAREAGRAALAGEAPLDLDLRIVRADGEIRTLHCRGGVAVGRDGSMDRIDGTCIDVTDRRRVEGRLAEAQRLAQIGSFDWDVARDEITWSREMYRIFGEDPERFTPTRAMFDERIVAEDYGAILEQVTRARRQGGDFDALARIRQLDGQLRDVRFRGTMVTTPGSAGEHLHGICQDLTDVRRAEEARAEAVERFRSVFERAPVGMALVARDGRFTLANEAMSEILGRPGGELLQVGVGHVTHPDDMPATADALQRMVAGELAEWNAEKRYVRPSGEIRWGALRALLLYDAEG